ncbi:MAG TPA: FAD-dependent oxidoreductase, partial [Polyangia bacterium]
VASPEIRNMGTVGGNLCQEPRCWYYRSPDDRFHCLRKGGDKCGAVMGENRYHSIFGAARTAPPACTAACPAHVAIPGYLEAIRGGAIDRAARLLLERNPMPAITGRVCPHLCETHCNRGELDEAVGTRAIERHLGDHILAHAAKFMPPPRRETRKRIAIVGAGPAGLAAAFYLRRAGHRVRVYDRMPVAGGMLTYCIPAYRLPKEVVARQIAAFERMGIAFELGAAIGGRGPSLRRLRQDHDRVFLATGAWEQKTLGLAREELLQSGLDLLVEVQRGRRQPPGRRVLVIGGGNVAVDVALAAKRLGAAEVTMACLEAREIMPAFAEDLAQALEEKITLLPSYGPHRVLARDGVVTGMELKRCTSVFDREGRFRPTFDAAATVTVAADCVLLAIGQGPDLAYAGRALQSARGLLAVTGETQATRYADVYAGGDAVTGAATVVAARAAGRRAAAAIDGARGGPRAAARAGAAAPVSLQVNTQALVPTPRVRATTRPPAARTIDAEDVATLDRGAIEAEARRCVNCGCVAVNASDLAPALLALEARIVTTHRTLAAKAFFAARLMSTTVLAPGELVTQVVIPAPPPQSVQRYRKFRLRHAIDFPIVGVATVLTVERRKIVAARVALGAVAPVPVRARAVEEFLRGKPLTEETAAVAGALAVRGVQPLGKNAFKVQIVRALLRQAILEAAHGR